MIGKLKTSLASRLGWCVLLYAMGVGAVLLVATIFHLLIMPLGH